MIITDIKKSFFTLTPQLLSVKVKSSGREHANFALMIIYISVMNQVNILYFSPQDDLRDIVFLNPAKESLCCISRMAVKEHFSLMFCVSKHLVTSGTD